MSYNNYDTNASMQARMRIAQGVGQQEVYDSGRGEKYTDGEYNLIIDSFKLEQKRAGWFYVIKYLVENSKRTDPKIAPRTRGERFDHLIRVDGEHGAIGQANTKKLVMAVMNLDNAKLDAAGGPGKITEFCNWASNEDPNAGDVNPLKGTRVNAATYRQATRTQKVDPLVKDDRYKWNMYLNYTHSEGAIGAALDVLANPPEVVSSDPAPTTATSDDNPFETATPTVVAEASGGNPFG